MKEKAIYNCHIHIFTHENIPDKFFPLFLIPALRVKPLRAVLRQAMKAVVFWKKNDATQRYSAFIEAAYRKNQEGNLKHLIGYYPKKSEFSQGTKFIVLPMDMAKMGRGRVKEDIDAQHAELARLANKTDYKGIIIPFAHIDPRREGALERLKSLVEEHNFKGVKIYPPLGYPPDDPVLINKIYPYMVDRDIPLLAHCSPGSVVNTKDFTKEQAHAFADPDNYRVVMDQFPQLRICLGHFGGITEWKRQLDGNYNSENPTWFSKIRGLIKCGDYPNLYADISYTVFNFHENIPLLKVLLEDEQFRTKVLFGSDFYMVESKKYSEKRLSLDLRYSLGEDLFWQIAHTNPKAFLK